MKDHKYLQCRELIRNNSGGIVVNLIRDNQEALGIEPGILDLVFDGFWDVYTFKPRNIDVAPRKLLNWIQKVKLTVNPSNGVPTQATEQQDDEESNKIETEAIDGQEPYDPIVAVVRIRIAKKQPEPTEEVEEGDALAEVKEEELEEMPIDDKCLSVMTHNDG